MGRTNAENMRAARERARQAGRCIVCRKREAKNGCSCCGECIYRSNERGARKGDR